MKILWATNIPFAHHFEMLGMKNAFNSGGSWLQAAYDEAKSCPEIDLHIVTSGNVDTILTSTHEGCTFHIVPGGNTFKFNKSDSKNKSNLKQLRNCLMPDAIVVWGTETAFGYSLMSEFKGIPTAIYMQGLIKSIYGHYYDGVPTKYHSLTLRDFADNLIQDSQINLYKNQVEFEEKMLQMADAVIIENDWCEDICRSINPKIQTYRNYLPIRSEFYNKRWDYDMIEPYSIFTNAGGYPIKGHHILFQALAIVKKSFPDFKCYIPGVKLDAFRNFKRKTGYSIYLEKIISENGLSDNIVFTGPLRADEMADRLAKSHLYVMPSIVENHSSSLIEALIVGLPSVSSLVGGTASLIRHNENGILYNSLDVESLAGYIIRILANKTLAKQLSQNAINTGRARPLNFGQELLNITKNLVKK